MQKNKRPSATKQAPRKTVPSSEQKEDTLVQKLYDITIDLVEQEDAETAGGALQESASDLQKLIKKCLYQKKDSVLYESLERTLHADSDAYRFLKERIDDASQIVLVKRGEAKTLEINAFVIPLFARTVGGLDSAKSFQDQDAYEEVLQSFKSEQLESPDATVVLIQHAYHMDEIDSISYCHLNEMVCEAYASMTDMRSTAIPAIERSFGIEPENNFSPDDQAVELRFLLGFALKEEDDGFYQVPDDEAGADHYFSVREARFRRWSEQVTTLVARCLGAEAEIDFLYQDLFFGGKERGIGEYVLLQMLSELNQALDEQDIGIETTSAIIGPAEVSGSTVLRVQLLADDSVVASADKPIGAAHDLHSELADTLDALKALGVKSLALAAGFDADGNALEVRVYRERMD